MDELNEQELWEAKDEGANFVLESLAQILGVTDWVQEDGSETWDGDVFGTLSNILAAGRILDTEDGSIAQLTRSPVTDEMVERAARALALEDRIEICSDATYRLSSYGPRARAALTAALEALTALAVLLLTTPHKPKDTSHD